MIAFIPCLGTKIRLTHDFIFPLMPEMRNRKLWDLHHQPPAFEIPPRFMRSNERDTPLYNGDEFYIERIYIRQGSEGFNSVTLKGHTCHRGVLTPVRFWMKLKDFNRMGAEVYE